MSESVPVWRQALSDDQHPLHRAAWMLFSKNFNLKYAEEALLPQQDEVVAFCNTILDARELYPAEALGAGNAPVHAVELLAGWKIEAAMARLLKILEEESWETIVYGTAADSIAAYGEALVEPLLDMATRKTKDEEQVAIAGTLADAAPGDPRTIEFVKKTYDSRKEEFEISYMAENVLVADPEGGPEWLRERLRTRKYSKETRKRIEQSITDKLAGKF